jgi:hypothetical protein
VTRAEWRWVLTWLLVAGAVAAVPVYFVSRVCTTGGILIGAC